MPAIATKKRGLNNGLRILNGTLMIPPFDRASIRIHSISSSAKLVDLNGNKLHLLYSETAAVAFPLSPKHALMLGFAI
jgi:hypothetical protein